jgi:uncharacterized protein (DUF2235 family)
MTDHKHVALFLDGTWNTVNDNTNVWRLKSLYDSGPDQKVYYSAGVGTAKGEKFTGGLFGFGIDEEVLNAYEQSKRGQRHYSPLFTTVLTYRTPYLGNQA